ncbi:MAG: ROK family protein [Actinomycetota bacterium]|nr:ROK family protein [Actinomycetota bacterium]
MEALDRAAGPTDPVGTRSDRVPYPDAAFDALVTVLDEIRLKGARSRSEIVSRTGLGRGIVANRVGELLDRGLVVEGEAAVATGGRRARQLRFHGEAGHVLVADLGATSVDVALTTLDGAILSHHEEPSDIGAGPEACLARVDRLLRQLIETTANAPGCLWGIGVALPGPVEFRIGRPIAPPIMPGWDGYPVREYFAAQYNVPVWVDNDVNVEALGEWRSGIAAGHQNVVVIKIGTGIGAGIISDGRIHRGAQGAAGDVGHVQVVDDSRVVCRCGNIGCLEALAGGAALGRDGEAAARSGQSGLLNAVLERRGTVTAEDVADAASHGDPVAIALIEEAGRRIGLMLATVVNFFNPSLVVIGGGVAQSGDRLLAAIRGTVYRRSLPLATRELLIQRSSLGGLAGVAGASSMVVDQLFSRGSLARWAHAGSPSGMPDIVLESAV